MKGFFLIYNDKGEILERKFVDFYYAKNEKNPMVEVILPDLAKGRHRVVELSARHIQNMFRKGGVRPRPR